MANIIQEMLHTQQFRAVTGEGGGVGLHVFYLKTHANLMSYSITYQGSFKDYYVFPYTSTVKFLAFFPPPIFQQQLRQRCCPRRL